MIKRLKLSSWRNYEDVSIEFDSGTTFVVASNGVGKTSLVEAARWALFGTPSGSASPVRVGADMATATVELMLPTGQMLTVERSVTAKASRQVAVPSSQLNGNRIDVEAFEDALRAAYGTEPAFLEKLTMPAVSREQDTPTALGLEGHLGRYFGVDGLQRAIALLGVELKNTEKQIRQIKIANASTARQLAELEAAVTAGREQVELATRGHNVAQAAHDIQRAHLQAREAVDAWTARHAEWLSLTNEHLREIAAELEEPVDWSAAESRLTARIDELGHLIENVRIQTAVRESRAEVIRFNQTSLDNSHEDCPVCRRPLDDTTVSLAHRTSEVELEALAAETAALRSDEEAALTRRGHVQALLLKLRSIPSPGPQPEVADALSTTVANIEESASKVATALEQLIAVRANQVDAERKLREAHEADDAMRQLTSLFGREANIRIALETTRATLDELLERTVKPLATEVDQRWKALFPNRGELTTRADGSITRNVNGHPLPYDAFSTGESTGATIVMRMLVAQMATTADFCWFDEPLEHLDPDVRRQVANILSRASDGSGQFRQVVVTTYEEPLARYLQARAPERVHLIDVRNAPNFG